MNTLPHTMLFDENNQFHCLDGPAIAYPSGSKQWYIHGNRHRENGPAVEMLDGTIEWWLNGSVYSLNDYIKELKMTKEDAVLFKLTWV